MPNRRVVCTTASFGAVVLVLFVLWMVVLLAVGAGIFHVLPCFFYYYCIKSSIARYEQPCINRQKTVY